MALVPECLHVEVDYNVSPGQLLRSILRKSMAQENRYTGQIWNTLEANLLYWSFYAEFEAIRSAGMLPRIEEDSTQDTTTVSPQMGQIIEHNVHLAPRDLNMPEPVEHLPPRWTRLHGLIMCLDKTGREVRYTSDAITLGRPLSRAIFLFRKVCVTRFCVSTSCC